MNGLKLMTTVCLWSAHNIQDSFFMNWLLTEMLVRCCPLKACMFLVAPSSALMFLGNRRRGRRRELSEICICLWRKMASCATSLGKKVCVRYTPALAGGARECRDVFLITDKVYLNE